MSCRYDIIMILFDRVYYIPQWLEVVHYFKRLRFKTYLSLKWFKSKIILIIIHVRLREAAVELHDVNCARLHLQGLGSSQLTDHLANEINPGLYYVKKLANNDFNCECFQQGAKVAEWLAKLIHTLSCITNYPHR